MILKHKYGYLDFEVSSVGGKIAVDMPPQFSYIRPPGSDSLSIEDLKIPA
jgi:hypothetical protein